MHEHIGVAARKVAAPNRVLKQRVTHYGQLFAWAMQRDRTGRMPRCFQNLKLNSTQRKFLRVRERASWRAHGHWFANEERKIELRILKPIVFARVSKHGNVWKNAKHLVHAGDVVGVSVREQNGLWLQARVTQELQQRLRRLAWVNHPTCGYACLPLIWCHFKHIGVGLAAAQFKGVKFES